MAKITANDLRAMQFVPEMFGENADTFETFLAPIITEQADLLAGRIGAVAYADSTQPQATYVKRAERCLVAAELYLLRFNRIAGDIQSADGMDASKLRRTRQELLDEAERLVARITAGATMDTGSYAGGVVETDHFSLGDDDA